MDVAEKVMKVVWCSAIVVMTIWLGSTLFLPVWAELPNLSEMGLFASVLLTITIILSFTLIWGFFAYGTSIIASVAGIILGIFAESIAWCYRKICP
ncbi:hypothetical protein ACLSYY_08945 [[Pasteurella] aerogenes]